MMVPVPEPWALLLIGLIVLAIVGVALYGMGAGIEGVVLGINGRVCPDRKPASIRSDASRYGRHALIAGGIFLACFAVIRTGMNIDLDLRLLLIAGPALLLGVAAIVLGRPSAGPGFRVLDAVSLGALVGLAIAAPVELSALQLDREAWRTIAETRERLAFADELMDEGYDQAVRAKVWSVHHDQTRRWARIGLEDARSGLRAADRLAAKAPDGPERRRLLWLRADFADQRERYEGFVRGLGEDP